jgi:cytoskeletal protein CcmA (bactofilin family)
MSFVVEIPSIFTKATQFPSRLGNTTLTGNETIQGNMVVNGSLTLSGTMNTYQSLDISYQSLDISSSLTVRGDTHFNSVFAETLEVDGATVLSDVSAHDLDLSGSLMVEGSTLLSDVSAHDLDLSGSLTVKGILGVTGLATFSGGISTNTVLVSNLPTDVSHATTKGYVDDSLNLKQDNIPSSTALSVNELIAYDLTISSHIPWGQLGPDIDGESPDDKSGHSVSINSDGTIVAIGAWLNDGVNQSNIGHTRVYQYNDISWVQLGQDIDGETAGDQSGYSVSINSDGTIVAIGAWLNDAAGNASGHTRVYKYNDISWVQLGPDIDGETADDRSGYSVSINADGTIVAIGAPLNDGAGNASGHTRVYKYNNTSWVKLGQDIDGETLKTSSGTSVSINADGTIVAIGAQLNDDGGNNSGHTRVYKYNNTSWVKLGQDIDGESDNDYSGTSVSINADGTIVAIGANFNDGGGTDSGHTRVYKYNNTSWVKLGQDIDGETAGDRSGWSVSINSDGTMVAIGAIYNKDGGTDSGHTRVYKYNDISWVQLGPDIDGESPEDRSGHSVSINADGTMVAIGANFNDGGGTDSGHTRVYKYNSLASQPSGTLGVTGLATFSGGISGENFSVADGTGDTTIGGTLGVTGLATFTGGISGENFSVIGGTLKVNNPFFKYSRNIGAVTNAIANYNYKINDNYNSMNSNGEYVVPVSGTYIFIADMTVATSSTMYVYIRNGTQYISGSIEKSGEPDLSKYEGMSISCIAYVNYGDKINVFISGTAQYESTKYHYFSGYMLSG